ncbi:GDP-mannose 4,6-dehydratase [Candidatus Pacearchaeota archaeon]|nr:GDP-mannose 4,6-dehydratase [Candidatus Pacearchaeota archaeon]
MTKKVLITGINGFTGSHLVDYILKSHDDISIHGTIRHWHRSNLENIEHCISKVTLHECNLVDSHNVNELIKTLKPDKVFHLAAQSHVHTSWLSPNDTYTTNIISQSNLFEAIRVHSPNTVILVAGSSEEYGLVHEHETPITEEQPLRPLSPYAVSKVAQDLMALQNFHSYGLKVIRTRAFNHSGPRRPPHFVDSSFAKQIASINVFNTHRDVSVSHGNLDAVRDFTHVKDIVRAYWLALELCEFGEVYNICYGSGLKIIDVLNKLIQFSDVNIKTEVDKNRMRPSDVPVLIGDYSKFNALTGWKPKFNNDDILRDTYDYWIAKLNV